MASPTFLEFGHTPTPTDTQWFIEQRILGALEDGGGGGGGGNTITTAEVWAASGVPAHTPTIDRQIYFDTDTGAQYAWYSSAWH